MFSIEFAQVLSNCCSFFSVLTYYLTYCREEFFNPTPEDPQCFQNLILCE